MPRLAANISWLFTELPLLERPGAARRCGFAAVECLFPYAVKPNDLAGSLGEAGTELVMFNLPAGAWEAGERGLAALPGRQRDFAASMEVARRYADRCGTKQLHVMAGIRAPDIEVERAWDCYVDNLRVAARAFGQDGISLLIEPINAGDMPGYFLATLNDAVRAQDAVGAPNLRIQADLYHLQIAGGDLLRRIGEALPRIGHVQVAAVPDRGEPDNGELRHDDLFRLIDREGYTGWVGCEYRPRGITEDGLGWAEPWLLRQA